MLTHMKFQDVDTMNCQCIYPMKGVRYWLHMPTMKTGRYHIQKAFASTSKSRSQKDKGGEKKKKKKRKERQLQSFLGYSQRQLVYSRSFINSHCICSEAYLGRHARKVRPRIQTLDLRPGSLK